MCYFPGRSNYEQKDDDLIHCWVGSIGSGTLFCFSECSHQGSSYIPGIYQLLMGLAVSCPGNAFVLSAGGPLADNFDIDKENHYRACVSPDDDWFYDKLCSAGTPGRNRTSDHLAEERKSPPLLPGWQPLLPNECSTFACCSCCLS